MKKAYSRLIATVLCTVLCGLFGIGSSALSTNEYGLGLSADSQETDGGATITLRLKNSNEFDVNDIKITHNIPDGLALRYNGDISPAHDSSVGYLLGTDTLAAGDTYEAQLVFSVLASPASETVEAPTIKKTNEKAIIAAVIAAVVIIAAAVIFARKQKRAAALMLALAMLLPSAGIFGVHAIGTDELRSFTLEDNISIGGKTYPLSITVNYLASTAKNSYFEIETADGETPEEGLTVTRFTADFNGKATANESVKSVTYEIRSESDGFAAGTVGEATLNGCEWSADNLHLKPGENTVTFTATLTNGETQTQVHSLYFDSGEIYKHTKSEETEENGTKYVKEIVNIYFDVDTTDERIEEILSEIGAERVGEINAVVMVQARIKADGLDGLNKKCKEIEKYNEVISASIEQILPLEVSAIPDDPWYYFPDSYQEPWNEDIPDGFNWHMEAVQAASAWDYDKYYNHVVLGMVDGPVMTDHEDFDNLIKFAGTYESDNVFATTEKGKAAQSHGTHVAGIMGAKANNGLGITGLLWDTEIYAANFEAQYTTTYIVDAMASHIANGAKAVNLSIGLSKGYDPNDPTYNPYLDPFSEYDLYSTALPCVTTISSLLKQGKEFVVIQAAGNGTIDSRYSVSKPRSVDASQTGLICAIDPDIRYGSLTTAQVQNVYDHTIVVGAAQNLSSSTDGAKFQMAYFSNSGERVDIYAPGYTIHSTATQQTATDGTKIQYLQMTGTSQAAPIVTAVAGLCFAINPDFTGSQVKSIICAEANTKYAVIDNKEVITGTTELYHPADLGDGRMVSMKLAAEAALRTVCGKANYAQLNRIIAVAQSLDPNDFTNYEIVQAVLDSIDYNLYEFQQDKVDAKYIELLDAMDKLIEKTPADYSEVEKAKAEAAALNKADYIDFSAVTAAVNAVVYGKYSDEQAAVDQMAADIRAAISALVPLPSINSDDYNVISDNTNKLIVITEDYVDSYAECLSAGGGYTLTHAPNSRGTYSTGSTFTLTRESYDDVVYTVAVIGDINANGKTDANDVFLAKMYALGMLEADTKTMFIAADADCDGAITESDALLIQEASLLQNTIFNYYTPGE